MKNKLLNSTIFLIICITTNVYADETYVCTSAENERVISVVHKNQADIVPCEVRYKKNGVTKVLWQAERQMGFCEEKAEKFVQKQIAWGWKCRNANSGENIKVIISNDSTSNQ